MQTYIALLRGVNVGGHRKVPMIKLRQLLTNIGLSNVKTYIQTGNVVFKSEENSTEQLKNNIEKAIENYFGFEVVTLVKTVLVLQQIFDNCPFDTTKKEQSYFVILSQIPKKALVKDANQKVYPNEVFYILNNCIYFYAEKGYGKAKFSLNYFEKKLQVSASARNYKTMLKLLTMPLEDD